jgi:hypothetical protein
MKQKKDSITKKHILYLSAVSLAAVTLLHYVPLTPKHNNSAEAVITKDGLNITRTLYMLVNLTGIGGDVQRELIANEFTVTFHIKGNHYSDRMIIPISTILENRNVKPIPIPIINNEEQHDDGSDFRVDVWVNNFDAKFQMITYPIKYNATYKSVDISEAVEYALQDMREEAQDDEENEDDDREQEYALIRDRPNNDKDDRPHAKVKDPKDDN